jgi:Uma2 family endonuclease
MTTAAATPRSSAARLPAPAAQAPAPDAGGQRFVFRGVSWEFYEGMLALVGERHVRVTYDRGKLELMAPSLNHEWWERRIGLILFLLALEFDIEIQGAGSTTFRREELDRGLEPDECFYVRHAAQMRGPREVDLSVDPPPDLAIEIDFTSSSLDRLGIYAALGVPEVWRCDTTSLLVLHLHAEGDRREYVPADRSLSLPNLPVDRLFDFILETRNEGEIGLARAVRAWVSAGFPSPPPAAGGPLAPTQ